MLATAKRKAIADVLHEYGCRGKDADMALAEIVRIVTPAKPGKLGRPKNARDRARSFLAHEMKTGEMPAVEIIALAEGLGISRNTLRRAADDLGIQRSNGRGSVWKSL
jgi:hypothetical protein